MFLSSRRLFTAWCSSLLRLLLGGLVVFRMELTPCLSDCAVSLSSWFAVASVAAMISKVGICFGAHVRNSADLVNQIHQISLEETDVMASFDVVSLFTRVPVNEALLVISQRLQQDDTLKDRTSIPIPDLCALVELCLKSTYFQFGKSFYEQVEGAAMGSPLSPIVANIFLEDLETRALETSAWKPKMWRRYVDDVLVVWPHGDQLLEEFHQHLNKQNPSIQFTVERESGGKIAFLDVQLEKKGPKILTSVFRKKTHTDRYLHFDSNHPARVKRGIIQCLRHRAEKVCNVQGQWLSGNRGEEKPQSPTNTYQLLTNQPASPQAPTTSICTRTQRED